MREKAIHRAVRSVMAGALLLVACGAADMLVSGANAQAPLPAPPPARNPAVEAAVATADKVLADPSKKEALCAYARARCDRCGRVEPSSGYHRPKPHLA